MARKKGRMIWKRVSDNHALGGLLTQSRSSFGLWSRNMSENAMTNPPQSRNSPAMSLANEPNGVRLPKALARRNRGKASCSSARKMYTF